MILKTVPRQAGTIVDPHVLLAAHALNQRPGQQGVFQRDFAVIAGTHDMDRTRLLAQLFAHGAVIHERRQ